MRLKTYTAKSMQEAMAKVRADLGPDAIILNSHKTTNNGVEVTVAIESEEPAAPAPKRPEMAEPAPVASDNPASSRLHEVRAILDHHGPAPIVVDAVLRIAAQIDSDDATLAIAAALDDHFHFLPIEDVPTKPLLLVGLPGAGKTVMAARLAADAILSGMKVRLITTDSLKAGAGAQIASYAEILKISPEIATSPRELELMLRGRPEIDMTIIDTPGTNPYDPEDLSVLQEIIATSAAEPVFVMPAGTDSMEARELGVLFADLGCRRLIATKLDMARRYGSLLSAALAGPLAFAGVTASPYIGDRMESLNPVSLARLLTAEPKASLETILLTPQKVSR